MRVCAPGSVLARSSTRRPTFSLVDHCRSWRASSTTTTFATQVAEKRYQVYVSKLDDPYVNLSIEHYLLQKSRKDSAVLFLYVNRPSIVIGRNQNPWLEVDLRRLQGSRELYQWSANGNRIPARVPAIDLVRRRSGGGTVCHDVGNVNYCVICPNSMFTRDKHAEMVVRAIRNRLNSRARVNERHDIVLDQGEDTVKNVDPEDTHRTPFEDPDKHPLKVSGSAYKMVRERTLHHGTCLINSPNLDLISGYLKSPAAAHIKALGVDSVRTPVANIFGNWQPRAVKRFQVNVIEEFLNLYDIEAKPSGTDKTGELVFQELDESHAELSEVQTGAADLRSEAWKYGQTPRFAFSPQLDFSNVALPWDTSYRMPGIYFALRSGVFEEATIDSEVQHQLLGRKVYEIDTFDNLLSLSRSSSSHVHERLGLKKALSQWLDASFAIKHR